MRKSKRKCRCRPPRRHTHCGHCGCSSYVMGICGACKESIPGAFEGEPTIRGTSRVICAVHKGLTQCEWCHRPIPKGQERRHEDLEATVCARCEDGLFLGTLGEE